MCYKREVAWNNELIKFLMFSSDDLYVIFKNRAGVFYRDLLLDPIKQVLRVFLDIFKNEPPNTLIR